MNTHDEELASKIRALSQSYSEQGPAPIRAREYVWAAIFLALLAVHLMGVLERNDLSARILEESVQRAECQRISESLGDAMDAVLVGAKITHGQKLINCKVKS